MKDQDLTQQKLLDEIQTLKSQVSELQKFKARYENLDPELLEAELKYKTLYENAPIPYQSLNEDGTFKDINPAWLQTLGYEREEVIGKRYIDFLHPSWKAHFEENFPAFKKRGYVHDVQFRIRHKKGNYLDIAFEGCIGHHPDGSFKQTYCVFQDITEKKKAEDKLRKSEIRLKSIIDKSSEGIAITDESGSMIVWNGNLEKLTGLDSSAILGKKVWDVQYMLLPEHLKNEKFKRQYHTEIKKLLKTGNSAFIDKPLIREYFKPDDSRLFLKGKITAIKSDKGYMLVSTTENITESKITELKLIRHQYLLKSAQEIAKLGSWELDLINHELYWTDQNYKIFGIPLGTALNYELFLDCVHPEDREYVNEKWMAAINYAPYDIEHRLLVNGKVKWVREKATVEFEHKNKPIKAIGFTQDITEQKLAEERFRKEQNKAKQYFDIADIMLINLDPNGNVTMINPKGCQILGYSEDEIIGKNWIDNFIPKHQRSQLKAVSKKVYSGEIESFKYFENYVLTKSGEEKLIAWHNAVLRDENNKTISTLSSGEDITEQKRTQQKLEENEARFKDLIELLPEAVFETDINFNLTYVNKRALEISGYTSEDIEKGLNGINLLVPEDRQRAVEVFQEHFDGFDSGILEYTAIKKDGSKFPILFNASPILQDGNLAGIRGIIMDITDQQKARKELELSEEKFKKAFITSPDSIAINRLKDGKYVSINKGFTEILGYSEDDVINRKSLRLNIWDDPNDRKKLIKELLEKGVVSNLEAKFRTNTGEIRYGLMSASIIDLDGIRNILSITRDITNRKRAENIQKLLYNISNAVSLSEDLEKLIKIIQKELGKIIDTENFYVALYDKETHSFSLPYHTDQKDKLFNTFPAGKSLTAYVIKTGQPLLANGEVKRRLEQTGEVELFGADSKVWLGVPLKIEGKVTGVFAVQSYTNEKAYSKEDMDMLVFVSDQMSISIERKRAEQNLKLALEKAKESDRLKSTFLATMSHELRTPLNAIIGFSDIISEDLELSDIISFNRTINSSGKQLLKIVEDLFDITLIETGQTKINSEETEIHSIMNDVLEITKIEQRVINKENIKLHLKLPQQQKALIVNTDPAKLKQILINLLKNALKFTNEGEINFGYTVKEENIQFFVSDTGIGIAKDKQGLIFDIFRQIEETHTRSYGGAGLGLSISKKLTHLLGGDIWLDSVEGKSSTFYFSIPYSKIKTDQHQGTINNGGGINLSDKTILIVEDDDSSYEFIRAVLSIHKMKNIRAENGKIAIQLCQENTDLDLVLMDINMPILNGYDATRQIKNLRPDLPVIAQTAYAIAGDREKSLAVGCDDYISKPIKKEELLAKIEQLLIRK